MVDSKGVNFPLMRSETRAFVTPHVFQGNLYSLSWVNCASGCESELLKTTRRKLELISLRVNDKTYELAVEPRKSLLDVLRENLGLTGAKKGCDMGSCGACTVLVDGKSRLSCITLASSVQGSNIITIEGLGTDGKIDPLQESFVRNDALQCGFCTPGQIMSAKYLLSVVKNPTLDEVKRFMSGNICRCGAYPKIFKAVLEASEANRNG